MFTFKGEMKGIVYRRNLHPRGQTAKSLCDLLEQHQFLERCGEVTLKAVLSITDNLSSKECCPQCLSVRSTEKHQVRMARSQRHMV